MSRRPDMPSHVYDTIIIGAGFTGIGAALKLAQAGVDDFVVLERSDRVGGTWRDNTYPGAACDVPSLLYSFDARSFQSLSGPDSTTSPPYISLRSACVCAATLPPA